MIKNKLDLHQELFNILDSSYDGIYITDGEANTLFLNKSYEIMTGINRNEIIGKNMRELIKKQLYDSSGSLLAIKTREKVSLRQKIVKNNKEVLITSTPVFENDKIKYVITNVRDISDLSSLQKRVQKIETLNKEYEEELKNIKENQKQKISNNYIRSLVMINLLEKISKLSKIDVPIMLEGETGVGKTFYAKYIHDNSERKENEFITLNCGAIPKNLIETELFGYVGGAYTGALNKGKMGVFELADNSTIFLDEISEFDLDMQVKLLKVLEEGEIRRVGSDKKIKVNFRLITASNKSLKRLVDEGKFREDLYYRISAFPISIPPLRERKEDILYLSLYFLEMFNKKYGLNKKFSSGALMELEKNYWCGNIRELKNVIEQSTILSSEDRIDKIIFNNSFEYSLKVKHSGNNYIDEIEKLIYENKYSLKEITEKIQKELIVRILEKENKQKVVANILKVDEATISRKLQKINML